jgi:hypothetical protein
MMKYELMNLDLDEAPPVRSFSVGPFTITLVPEYDDIHLTIPQMAKRSGIAKNENERYVTKEEPGRAGNAAITAIAECDKEPDSVFYLEEGAGIRDLCDVLSYLTGRRVFLPEEERFRQHNRNGFPAIHVTQIAEAAQVAWENRETFSTQKEKLPLWYYLVANDSPYKEIKTLVGCVTLEIIQKLEESKIELSTSEALKNLIMAIKDDIDRSNIDTGLKSDLKSTVGNWGGKNAQELFKRMLVNYGLISEAIEGVSLKRVRGIFKMRHAIVHDGEIKNPDWVEGETAQRKTTANISGNIIPAIVTVYLNQKFNIEEFGFPKQNKNLIIEYIINGTIRGEEIEK